MALVCRWRLKRRVQLAAAWQQDSSANLWAIVAETPAPVQVDAGAGLA
jgi:hypothetical protein